MCPSLLQVRLCLTEVYQSYHPTQVLMGCGRTGKKLKLLLTPFKENGECLPHFSYLLKPSGWMRKRVLEPSVVYSNCVKQFSCLLWSYTEQGDTPPPSGSPSKEIQAQRLGRCIMTKMPEILEVSGLVPSITISQN